MWCCDLRFYCGVSNESQLPYERFTRHTRLVPQSSDLPPFLALKFTALAFTATANTLYRTGCAHDDTRPPRDQGLHRPGSVDCNKTTPARVPLLGRVTYRLTGYCTRAMVRLLGYIEPSVLRSHREVFEWLQTELNRAAKEASPIGRGSLLRLVEGDTRRARG